MGYKMVKLGKPLPPIGDDYVEPAPDELDRAELIVLWNQYAPRQYRYILEAKPIEDRDEISSIWYWDQSAREYVHDKSGRRVPVRDMQPIVRKFVQKWTNA